MFATFAVKAEGKQGYICFTNVDKYNEAPHRCQRAIRALHGIYGALDYDRIMRNNSRWPYPVGEMRKANVRTMQSWSQHLFKQTWMYMPIYSQVDLAPERPYGRVGGLITTERLRAIREVLANCAKTLAQPLKVGEMRQWACGYAELLAIMHESEENMPKDCVQVAPRTDSQSMSALFWLLFCKYAWKKAIHLSRGNFSFSTYHPSCPNVCARYHGNPCLGKDNVIQLSSSLVIGSSLHRDRIHGVQICRSIDNDFGENGEMVEGYATLTDQAYECGYVWSKETKSCVLENGCSGKSACDPRGTRMCVSSVVNLPNSLSLPFVCLCFAGYMGPRCEKRRDACIENEDPNQLSGNQACRVYLGNSCEPRVGTNIYTCHCSAIYSADDAVAFPNCYRRKQICAGVICRRGDCVSSRDQLSYVCVCQMGWRGRHCDTPDIRMWLPWEAWSGCSAQVCTGLGWRHRVRHCRANLTQLASVEIDKGLCEGEDVQRQLCKAT
ncbi:Cadherin-related tumor suppressor [Taenia crassiceps]|uniref:Cadherin-related tumor suppressor n=1 Tax=Taenia crassiceps TaxID=6207 RepID=A0ABR4Q8H4_9CEST